jgi:hypothetical protein
MRSISKRSFFGGMKGIFGDARLDAGRRGYAGRRVVVPSEKPDGYFASTRGNRDIPI